MANDRQLFRVTTKAVIYTPDRKKVLVIYIPWENHYGLPGGHIEAGETPDDTIKRELTEETGVSYDQLRPINFFIHRNGKVVLVYLARSINETLCSSQNEIEGTPCWLTKAEFKKIDIEPNSRRIVLENWK